MKIACEKTYTRRMLERIGEAMPNPTEELNQLFGEVTNALMLVEPISDETAEILYRAIERRRKRQRDTSDTKARIGGHVVPLIKLPASNAELKAVPAPDSDFEFAERARRMKRIGRRRYLSAVCSMPAELKELFTISELAVLSQVVIRCADHGRCDLAVAAIALRANVAERTVQSTIRKAKKLLLLSVKYRRRMTSILTVTNELWRKWIKNTLSRTENQKCSLKKESMDPLQGAKIEALIVSKEAKAPSKLDHSEPAMTMDVAVLERPALAPQPKPIVRVATRSVEDRLASARAVVEEAAKSRPVSDVDDWERPSAKPWMTPRDRSWLANWEVAERLDSRKYPNMVTDRGAVRTEVLDWLGRQWGSAGARYSIHRFMRGTKTEIQIGFAMRAMITEFAARWAEPGTHFEEFRL